MSRTAALAPPCSGPDSACTPAEMLANTLASLEPTTRTVEVEQFCSWSACSTNSMSRALATSGSTWYVLGREAEGHPQEVLDVSVSELSGYRYGWPIERL